MCGIYAVPSITFKTTEINLTKNTSENLFFWGKKREQYGHYEGWIELNPKSYKSKNKK